MDDTEITPIIIGKLLNIGGMLQREANRLLLPFGLNQQQFSILFEIHKAGRVNQRSMINRLVLEKAHVSKVVKKLVAMNLIDTTIAPSDKRSTWLSLTPKGSDMVGCCRKIIQTWNKEWISGIDQEKLPGILENLTNLQKAFKEKACKEI